MERKIFLKSKINQDAIKFYYSVDVGFTRLCRTYFPYVYFHPAEIEKLTFW